MLAPQGDLNVEHRGAHGGCLGREPALRGGDARDGARARRRRPPGADEIQALLQARVDSLDGGLRTVLERGAVEGEVFHRGSVAALHGGRAAGRSTTCTSRASCAASSYGPRPRSSRERGRVPFPASPDPRRRLRGDPEGRARGAPGARRLVGANGAVVRVRAQRHRRLPPRAGAPLPAGARCARRGTGCAGGLAAPRRPGSVRSRRSGRDRAPPARARGRQRRRPDRGWRGCSRSRRSSCAAASSSGRAGAVRPGRATSSKRSLSLRSAFLGLAADALRKLHRRHRRDKASAWLDRLVLRRFPAISRPSSGSTSRWARPSSSSSAVRQGQGGPRKAFELGAAERVTTHCSATRWERAFLAQLGADVRSGRRHLSEELLAADYANAALKAQALQILALFRGMLGNCEHSHTAADASPYRGVTSRCIEGPLRRRRRVRRARRAEDLDRAEHVLRRAHDASCSRWATSASDRRSTAILSRRPIPPGPARRGARARRREPRDRGSWSDLDSQPRSRAARARVLGARGAHDEALDLLRGGGRARRADRLPRAQGVRPRGSRRGARGCRPHGGGRGGAAAGGRVPPREGERRLGRPPACRSGRPSRGATLVDSGACRSARAAVARTRTTPASASRAARRSRAAAPAREVRKIVTVLFCDVAGSTALGERPTRRRCGADGPLLRGIARDPRAARRHGREVHRRRGDGRLRHPGRARGRRAAGGPRRGRDARAADQRARAARLRIGVNTGEVVAGEGETLVTGDAVNVAARLEQAAAPGEILIGAETYRLVRDAVARRAGRAARR